ncbi:MAG TPA: plastocyanin/azurin family copper-binding protein [Acidimicrobiia bacterium]|nr:plastocyanin/azurin family copper-binding protein [Acidimicrobiia bacterium]
MTQTTTREERTTPTPRDVPSHPHYTLGTLIIVGVLGTLAALGIAVAALMITASRDSVDDALVSDAVDGFLAEADLPIGLPEDVIPDLVAKSELEPVPASEVNVAVAPEMPPPSGRTTPAIVDVEFEVVEGVNSIDPTTGVETETWGYRLVDGPDSVVVGTPGPVIRARVGDVLRFTISNPAENANPHNVDFHAVTGQGGGAEATTVAPGETKTIEARLLYPGFFMYHCAHGDIPSHISHGMYGGILVDPETPLPTVEHEWYMVQSEYYTASKDPGVVEFDRQAVTDESPTYVVFNGAVGALAGDNALTMTTGEKARIYFINAGLNLDSNFHPIGSHWDKVYQEAALLNPPLRGSQTTLVPAGGGTVVELIGQVPSTIVLVDHALSRAVDKGAIGQIVVSGDPNLEIFEDITGGEAGATDGHEMGGGGDAGTVGEQVSIVAAAWTTQDLGAADEFAEAEDPADYSVNVLTIPVGTTVTWTNNDPGMIHTVTSVDGLFDSGFFNEGETWSYTFDDRGEFEYFCTPHPWMRAKVIVGP